MLILLAPFAPRVRDLAESMDIVEVEMLGIYASTIFTILTTVFFDNVKAGGTDFFASTLSLDWKPQCGETQMLHN